MAKPTAAAVLEGLANAEIETASWTKVSAIFAVLFVVAFIAITVPMVMAIVNLSNAATPAYEAIEGTATDVGTLVNMVMHDAKNPPPRSGARSRRRRRRQGQVTRRPRGPWWTTCTRSGGPPPRRARVEAPCRPDPSKPRV